MVSPFRRLLLSEKEVTLPRGRCLLAGVRNGWSPGRDMVGSTGAHQQTANLSLGGGGRGSQSESLQRGGTFLEEHGQRQGGLNCW